MSSNLINTWSAGRLLRDLVGHFLSCHLDHEDITESLKSKEKENDKMPIVHHENHIFGDLATWQCQEMIKHYINQFRSTMQVFFSVQNSKNHIKASIFIQKISGFDDFRSPLSTSSSVTKWKKIVDWKIQVNSLLEFLLLQKLLLNILLWRTDKLFWCISKC